MFEETMPPETQNGIGETSEVDPAHAPLEEEKAPMPGDSRSPMEEEEVTLSSLNIS